MSRNPLGILKRGFTELTGKIKDRKDKLNAKLSWGEAIFPSDEQWLDNEGNTVDEHHILEVLESAPDYERAVAELDNNGKAIVNKLREWAGVLEDERIKLSNGRLAHFKERNGLQEIKRHGEAASAKPETVEHERSWIQDLIQEAGYKPHNIYNMDETGLFYVNGTRKGPL
ncbi:hypothetical protein H4582DRAFT_2072114 [Lactarius indigo]|nr:hypothetical protein H4582DRAFT_2072114 [Lactarius indigo]